MKKQGKSAVKEDLATGMSSAAGATAGVFIGNLVSEELMAKDEIKAEVLEEGKLTPSQQEEPDVVAVEVEQTYTEPEPKEQTQRGNVAAEDDYNPEVAVVGYEKVSFENGQEMEVATVSVDGEQIAILDVNMDGKADLMARDYNNNGELEDGEVENIQQVNLSMSNFKSAAIAESSMLLADNEDYVNDADIDSYA